MRAFPAVAFVPSLLLLCFPVQTLAQSAAALFKAKCAICHGANGDANTAVGRGLKLRDLRSPDVQQQTDAQLKLLTDCGKGQMPGYQGKFTNDQITQLVGYIRALAKK